MQKCNYLSFSFLSLTFSKRLQMKTHNSLYLLASLYYIIYLHDIASDIHHRTSNQAKKETRLAELLERAIQKENCVENDINELISKEVLESDQSDSDDGEEEEDDEVEVRITLISISTYY